MNKTHSIIFCALAFSVTACASAGNQVLAKEDAATVSQSIVNGRSTKADVQAAYGDPNDTSFTDGGNEIWKYTYAYATPTAVSFVPIVGLFAGGLNVDKKTLVILFDKSGVVTNHTMSSSREQMKRGG